MSLTELEEIVLDEIIHLSFIWKKSDFEIADLRRASGILRSLLVDQGGTLQKIASARNTTITVSCPINDDIISHLKGVARIYTCGCTAIGGVTPGPFWMVEGPMHDKYAELPSRSIKRTLHGRQELSLSGFKEQICAMWMGVAVTREEVIKYVANKLGGRYYDERRQGKLALKYIALDTIREFKTGLEDSDRKLLVDKVYFELLATGRFLTESESVRKLVSNLEVER